MHFELCRFNMKAVSLLSRTMSHLPTPSPGETLQQLRPVSTERFESNTRDTYL